MTLVAETQLRFSTQHLVELTNTDDTTVSSVNIAKITTAADDAEQYFEVYTGVEFDTDNKKHVAIAVDLVEILLTRYSDHKRAKEDLDAFIPKLRDFGLTLGRDRIPVTTTSEYEPTREGGTPTKDWADRRTFERFIPNHPQGFNRNDRNT